MRIFSCVLLLFLTGCDSGASEESSPAAEDLLPLQVGNRWVGHLHLSPGSSIPDASPPPFENPDTLLVLADTVRDGLRWFRIVSTNNRFSLSGWFANATEGVWKVDRMEQDSATLWLPRLESGAAMSTAQVEQFLGLPRIGSAREVRVRRRITRLDSLPLQFPETDTLVVSPDVGLVQWAQAWAVRRNRSDYQILFRARWTLQAFLPAEAAAPRPGSERTGG